MPVNSTRPYGVLGGYESWSRAAQDADRYTTDLAVYAKICDEIKHGRSSSRDLRPILAGFETIDGPVRVLDFGGNLGMVYFELNRIVPDRIASWVVADFPEVCDHGTRHLADGKLSFTDSLDTVKPDLVLACHALQYLEHPYDAVRNLAALGPKAIVLHELPIAVAGVEFAVQNLIPELGGGRRAVQSLDLGSIVNALPGYDLVSQTSLPVWAPALRARQTALLFVGSNGLR